MAFEVIGFEIELYPAEVPDSDYGVPSRVIPLVATDIVRVVAVEGLEPADVAYSGFNERWPKTPETDIMNPEASIRRELLLLAKRAEALVQAGKFDDAARETFITARGGLQERLKAVVGGLVVYAFNTELTDDCVHHTNPICFAGTGEDAVIGVYSAHVLEALDPNYSRGGVGFVETTPDRLDTALLGKYYPRYTNVQDEEVEEL